MHMSKVHAHTANFRPSRCRSVDCATQTKKISLQFIALYENKKAQLTQRERATAVHI